MTRRDFFRTDALVSAGLSLPRRPGAGEQSPAAAPAWRTFEVTTRVEVLQPSGPTRVWLPAPLTIDTDYQRTMGSEYKAEGGTTSFASDPTYATGIVIAEWPAGVAPIL